MATRVKVMAILAPKAGHEAELETLLRSMAEASRKEPGNLHYDLWHSPDQPGHFVLDEAYVDDEAVAFHRGTPYFQAYLSRINDLAERTVFVLGAVDVVPGTGIATKIDPGQDRSANAGLSFRHDAENPLSPLGP